MIVGGIRRPVGVVGLLVENDSSSSSSSSKDGSDAMRCDVDAMQCNARQTQTSSKLQTSWRSALAFCLGEGRKGGDLGISLIKIDCQCVGGRRERGS